MSAPELQTYGQFSVRYLNVSQVRAGDDPGQPGTDGQTDGDLIIQANDNGNNSAVVFATLHYHDSIPTFAFSSGANQTRIQGVAVPSADTDVANKEYTDSEIVAYYNGRSKTILDGNLLQVIGDAGAHAWTAAELLSGLIVRNGVSSDITDTLPAASVIIAAITNAVDGSSIELSIQKGGSHTISFAPNSTGGGSVIVSSGTATTGLFAPVLQNLRTSRLRLIVLNVSSPTVLLTMISDR